MFSNGSRRSMADNKTEMAGKNPNQRDAYLFQWRAGRLILGVFFFGGGGNLPVHNKSITSLLTHTHK
jgi:hypothetical protein